MVKADVEGYLSAVRMIQRNTCRSKIILLKIVYCLYVRKYSYCFTFNSSQ